MAKFLRRLSRTLEHLNYRIWKFADNYRPVICKRCGTVHAHKNMHFTRHSIYGFTWICEKCNEELYHPFTRGEK